MDRKKKVNIGHVRLDKVFETW